MHVGYCKKQILTFLGLTPFQLAAHKNDYVMLRILHSHGYGYVCLT